MPCDMPMQLSEKGAMKEVLQALTKQMWNRMKAGKSEASMSTPEVAEALEEAGEEGMEGMEEPMETAGAEPEGKPKGRVMELSTVKLGLLGPNRRGGMRAEPKPEMKSKKKGK